MTKPQPAAPRSLADALRQRDDSGIAGLLTARPDLLHPVPSDFTALATRATSGPSVSRCLDALTSLELFVLSTAAHLSSDAAVDTSDLADAATAVADATAVALLNRIRPISLRIQGTGGSRA